MVDTEHGERPDERSTQQAGIEINGNRFSRIQSGPNQSFDMGFYGYRSRRIYIDFENSPRLQDLYNETKRSIEETGDRERAALEAVYRIVDRTFTRREFSDVHGYFGQQAERADMRGNLNVSLDEFAREGIGNCVQTTLTCAVFLERLKKDGFIEGDVFLDRYEDEEASYDHVWCVDQLRDGSKFMIDLILEFVGDEEAFKPKFVEMAHRISWSY